VRIIHFERDGDFSLGVATGEGVAFRFAVANATGRIALLQEKFAGSDFRYDGGRTVEARRRPGHADRRARG
jgi:hypothetical protein